MGHFEIFGGLIRANPLLLLLDILLLIHFWVSYKRDARSKGFKVDLWHSANFLSIFIPVILMYPFAGSIVNMAATGPAIYEIQNYVDRAYIITVIGYVSSYLGYYFFNATKYKGFGYALIRGVDSGVSPYIKNSIRSKVSIYTIAAFGIFVSSVFLLLAWQRYGVGFGLRDAMLADPQLKPIYNFVLSSFVPIGLVMLGIRYLQFKEQKILYALAIFTIISFFSGSRGTVLNSWVSLVLYWAIAQKERVNLLKLGVMGSLILLLVFYLGDLRAGQASIVGTLLKFGFNFFYGNNFSDVRDFGWVLSAWDHAYLLGKSYAAGIISFIPRSFSEFREVWSIGVYTAQMVGFDPSVHAGLRPGRFGEVYFNFGILGVICLGFVSGYVLRYADFAIKKFVNEGVDLLYVRMYAATFLYLVISNFYISAGFWSLYVFGGVLALGYLSRHILSPALRARSSHTDVPGV